MQFDYIQNRRIVVIKMKKVAIIQSNYIPWKGYFDIIHDVDEFIFHDDLQYTKNDWRNRNKILTNQGDRWLTIPVGTNEHRLIQEVRIKDHIWQKKHWNLLELFYKKSPFFDIYRDYFEDIYLYRTWEYLSELNQHLIKHISKAFLGIKTTFTTSSDYTASGKKQTKVLELLKESGADCYVSGSAAKSYIEEDDFRQAGIKLIWKDYSGYPEYPQQFEPFVHNVSILDLLFNVGNNAPYYIWEWRGE